MSATAQRFVPFTAAAHEYREKIWTTSFTPGAATVDLSPPNGSIKPYGYLRALRLKISCAGGTGGNLNADAPFNVLSQLSVTQPNGQELYGGPLWSGYDAMLAAKYAGWQLATDPALLPSYSASVAAFSFDLVIPFEMDRASGLGCLPNEDATAPWKLQLTGNTSAAIWQTAPTTAPVVTVGVWMDCWTVPSPINPITRLPQAIAPPALGTLQKWTKQVYSVSGGSAQEIDFSRKGNAYRGLVMQLRNSSAARIATSNYPSPLQIVWDGTNVRASDDTTLMVDDDYMTRGGAAGSTPQTADTGILPLTFTRHTGVQVQGTSEDFGLDEFWGTVQSSTIGISGSWGATATQLQVLTNDVQVVSLAGNPYDFAAGTYLQAPAQASSRS